MKMHWIIAMMAAMLFVTMASAQSPDNAVWGVNDRNEVFRWHLSGNGFEGMPGRLKQVSVGTDGEVWGIDPDDNVLRWTGSQWQQLQGEKLKQLSVRNAQEVWGVNAESHLFRWTGSAWERIRPFEVAFVSAGVDSTVWGIGKEPGVGIVTISAWLESQTLYPLESTDSHLTRISVTDGNRAWAIDDNKQLFRWTGATGHWEKIDGDYIDVAQAANGELWTLASDGTVLFKQDPSAPPLRMDAVGASILAIPHNFLLKQIAVGSARAMFPELTADQQQMLDTHNRERQNYPGVNALQWSPELERWAQEWAQAVASGDKSGHRQDQRNNPFRPGEGLGENMYAQAPSSGVTGVNAVNWFISEKQWYNHEQDTGTDQPPGCTAPPNSSCGHFTQVIWKNTQYVGCGKAISADDTIWYVCNYYPPGNSGGKPY